MRHGFGDNECVSFGIRLSETEEARVRGYWEYPNVCADTAQSCAFLYLYLAEANVVSLLFNGRHSKSTFKVIK